MKLFYGLLFLAFMLCSLITADREISGESFRDCAVCPEMILIAEGSFLMGAPDNEPGRYEEEGPVRKVNISRFAAGKFHVTRGEWAAFVKATNRIPVEGCDWSGLPENEAVTASWNHVGFRQDDKHPVVCISWDDAQDYISWLGKKTGFKYRLLTEAEWEYAARAGSTTPYPWGSDASHEFANYGKDTCCTGLALGLDQWAYGTSPVGSFPPNAYGLYDMHGNVMQWVEDCFSGSYIGLPTDGSAYTNSVPLNVEGDLSEMNGKSSCDFRMCRGGDFNNPPAMIRSASRNWAPIQAYRSAGLGFRVAKSL